MIVFEQALETEFAGGKLYQTGQIFHNPTHTVNMFRWGRHANRCNTLTQQNLKTAGCCQTADSQLLAKLDKISVSVFAGC